MKKLLLLLGIVLIFGCMTTESGKEGNTAEHNEGTTISLQLKGDDSELFSMSLHPSPEAVPGELNTWRYDFSEEEQKIWVSVYMDSNGNGMRDDEKELTTTTLFILQKGQNINVEIMLLKSTIKYSVNGSLDIFSKPMVFFNRAGRGSSAQIIDPLYNDGSIITYGNLSAPYGIGGDLEVFDDLNANNSFDRGEPIIFKEAIDINVETNDTKEYTLNLVESLPEVAPVTPVAPVKEQVGFDWIAYNKEVSHLSGLQQSLWKQEISISDYSWGGIKLAAAYLPELEFAIIGLSYISDSRHGITKFYHFDLITYEIEQIYSHTVGGGNTSDFNFYIEDNLTYYISSGNNNDFFLLKTVDGGNTWNKTILYTKESTYEGLRTNIFSVDDEVFLLTTFYKRATKESTTGSFSQFTLWKNNDETNTWERIQTIDDNGYISASIIVHEDVYIALHSNMGFNTWEFNKQSHSLIKTDLNQIDVWNFFIPDNMSSVLIENGFFNPAFAKFDSIDSNKLFFMHFEWYDHSYGRVYLKSYDPENGIKDTTIKILPGQYCFPPFLDQYIENGNELIILQTNFENNTIEINGYDKSDF